MFTGDIGRVRDQNSAPGKVVRSGPTEGETADILVMESTYGNRQHPTDDPRPELAAIIRQTVERGGSVVVPAFAVERTQKFLFMLKELMESGQIPRVPVYCDSPMAIKAVEIFLKHAEECTDETCRLIKQYGSPLQWPGFTFALTPEESKKINDTNFPVDHHFLERHGDRRTHPASPGAAAARSEEYGDLHRIPGAGNARSHHQERRAGGAHLQRDRAHPGPDRGASSNSAITPIRRSCWNGCARFLKSPRPLTWCTASRRHRRSLRDAMTKELGWNVQVAEWMEKVEVNSVELCTNCRISIRNRNWQSECGAFMTESELKKHLEAAEKSPKQIAAAVSGLPDKVLRYKPAPDKWCILEILGHLADIEIVYAYRLRQMLADKKPVIAPMDQDDWARNLGYMETPPAELVALYGLNRHAQPAIVAAPQAGGPRRSRPIILRRRRTLPWPS